MLIHCFRKTALLVFILGLLLFFTSAVTLAALPNSDLPKTISNNSASLAQDSSLLKSSDALLFSNSRPLVVRLKYLKAEQVKQLLTSLISDGGIRIESINNTLLIIGSDGDYDQIKTILAQIDVPPRQIMFEAEAVEISRTDLKHIGIDWGAATALPEAATHDGNAFRINLGIPNHPEYGVNVRATINRLIEDKKARLLASPRIAALDGETAKILIGDRLAVESRQVVDGSEVVSVNYIDVGIKLEVTPNINEDGTITTHIKPEVSNKTDETKNGNPNIRTRQAETTLRVNSGETIVLGGLIQREENNEVFKVPLLGDIPLVGQLFRSTNMEKRETELVILITPKKG